MDTTQDDEAAAVIGSGYSPGDFQSRLLACWQGIDALVLALAGRYDLVVILSALAEHTGTGLLALMRYQPVGAPQVLRLIHRMQSNAFPNDSAEQHHEK